ncbi:TIM barrel protein [candidate division KSB1 bacterium]|nr:TIM barrel protein [candidate division KSB1 bacterium]
MDRQIGTAIAEFLQVFTSKCKDGQCGIILDVSSDLTHNREEAWLGQIEYVKSMLGLADQIGTNKVRILLGGQSFSFQTLFQKFRGGDSDRRQSENRSALKNFVRKMLVNHFTVHLSHVIRRRQKAKIRNEAAKVERASLAIERILPEAEMLGIPLVIENHWGISSRPENILNIIERFGSPYLGACPDFDNFPKDVDPYNGLAQLAPKAQHVHAKSRTFDRSGEQRRINYRRCVDILKAAGYEGSIAVEYEGSGDPLEGAIQTRDLILKYWEVNP